MCRNCDLYIYFYIAYINIVCNLFLFSFYSFYADFLVAVSIAFFSIDFVCSIDETAGKSGWCDFGSKMNNVRLEFL